jgi:hypothetical protein
MAIIAAVVVLAFGVLYFAVANEERRLEMVARPRKR